jgi:hypothetical protein
MSNRQQYAQSVLQYLPLSKIKEQTISEINGFLPATQRYTAVHSGSILPPSSVCTSKSLKRPARTSPESTIFWDITPCSPLSVNRSFGGTYVQLIFSTLKMEAILSSETSVDTQRTTRRYIPEDGTLNNHRCENLRSCKNKPVWFLLFWDLGYFTPPSVARQYSVELWGYK